MALFVIASVTEILADCVAEALSLVVCVVVGVCVTVFVAVPELLAANDTDADKLCVGLFV